MIHAEDGAVADFLRVFEEGTVILPEGIVDAADQDVVVIFQFFFPFFRRNLQGPVVPFKKPVRIGGDALEKHLGVMVVVFHPEEIHDLRIRGEAFQVPEIK